MKEKRLHLRANKDNPPSPSSSDTESSEDVDPNYGKIVLQLLIGPNIIMTLSVLVRVFLGATYHRTFNLIVVFLVISCNFFM